MEHAEHVDSVLAEIKAEVERQVEQWGVEHDEQHTARDWICIVTKHLGRAFDEDDSRFKHPHERGVDQRFVKIAAICVSAVIGLRANFR